MDNLKSKFGDILLSASNHLLKIKSEAEDLADKGKEKVQIVKNEIKTKYHGKIPTQS